jgi:predicted 3-demethylubiquinone-9 3-methyltransferase (glyoxalase superfamily)
MRSIDPCLVFNSGAEDAAAFYVSLFPGARLGMTHRYGPDEPGPAGSICFVEFEIAGQKYVAVNAGQGFPGFTDALSLAVQCDTQAEIDRVWERLADGGKILQCGWVRDRFGVSWQVVPARFTEMMRQGTSAQRARVMQAVYAMVKLDLAALEQAYAS